MRNILSFIFFTLFIVSCNRMPAYKDASLPVEKRIDDLLSRMTIEEKAAQLDMLAANDILENSDKLLETGARVYIDSMKIGAIHDLYPKSAVLANEIQKRAHTNTRLGIPLLFIEEALHGYQGAGATTFPIPLGNASAWDTTLVYKIGRAIATEARAHGIHFVLGPNLDLARDPRWGRVEETFGEDTYLTSRMGVSLIKGLQGEKLSDNNAVVAEPKHFALHGSPESGSNEGPVFTGEREARSTGLYVFEKAVKEAGARGIMAAYNEIDGIPCVANEWLLSSVLRKEWGFDGMVVSDLGAINRQIRNHKTAANKKEAIVNALIAGLDMQFYDFSHSDFQQTIVESVNDGTLPLEYLDRAVRSVLRVKFLLGLFETPYTDESLLNRVLHNEEHKTLALDAARQYIVLLQNDSKALPIDKTRTKRITLTGNLANSTYTGGYSPAGAKAISVYEALKKMSPGIEVDYVNAEVSNRFSSILPDYLSSDPASSTNGLKTEYFNNTELSGNPAYSATDANLNPYWHNLSPAPGVNPDCFSIRWSGYITAPVSGMYEFSFRSKDYGRLFIKNLLLADHWKNEMIDREEKIRLPLTAGETIPFKIEFAKLSGNAGMWLKWRLANAENPTLYADITRSAAQSDMTLVVMGETQEEVGESRDRQNLHPHKMDMDILKAAVKAGKPVVVVMITGRPLILTEINELSSAILQTWFPGEATGAAVCDVLFGEYNPSGRLAVSFPKSMGQLPVYYSRKPSSHRRYVDGDGEPLFPFGYGLSYSEFEYKNLSVEPENPGKTDKITVSLDVTNTSPVPGEEVVQLYLNDEISSVTTPVKELKGFAKVRIAPGMTERITMTLYPEQLSLINKEMKRVVEPGAFEIMIGSSSAHIRLRQTINVKE